MLWAKQAIVSEALVQLIKGSRKSPFHPTEESGWGLIFTLWSRLRQQLHGWSSPAQLPRHAALQLESRMASSHTAHNTPRCHQGGGEKAKDLGLVSVFRSDLSLTGGNETQSGGWLQHAWSCSLFKASPCAGAFTISLGESQFLPRPNHGD